MVLILLVRGVNLVAHLVLFGCVCSIQEAIADLMKAVWRWFCFERNGCALIGWLLQLNKQWYSTYSLSQYFFSSCSPA